MKSKLIASLYVLMIVGIVYMAAHQNYHQIFSPIRSIPFGDKIGHFLLMGGLSFLINLSLRCRTVAVRSRRMLLGTTIVILVVTLEEVSQLFVQYRSFDLVDLLFDYLGIWTFGKMAQFVSLRRGLKERNM